MSDKSRLYWRLVDALSKSEAPVYCVGGSNPYDIHAGALRLRVHVSAVHDADRSDEDEARIQCRGELPAEMRSGLAQGLQPVVLGYAEDSDVFCAWDPSQFVKRGDQAGRFSLYTRWSVVERAAKSGLAVYVDNKDQRVLAFDDSAAFGYCAAAPVAHRSVTSRTSGTLYKLLASALGAPKDVPTEPPGILSKIRKKVTKVTAGYARDPQFPKLVLPAYGWSCAMCGVQLGLVDAAHIVPHGHPKGVAHVRNGVALCKLHHAAYDTSLLYIDDSYRIILNQTRVDSLKDQDRAEGLGAFAGLHNTKLALPQKSSQHPDKGLIRLANSLRTPAGLAAGAE